MNHWNTSQMSSKSRIITSIAIGLIWGSISLLTLRQRGYLAADFQWPLRAGRILLAGQNPYILIQPDGLYPFSGYFFFPLPAGLIGLLFAPLNDYLAGALFFGASTAILTFSILHNGAFWQLIMLASPSMYVAAYTAQWSPLIMATAFIPALSFFSACKPNVGLATFAYINNKTDLFRATLSGLSIIAISLLVMPSWPLWWVNFTSTKLVNHYSPIIFFGILGLAAFPAVGSRQGRVMLMMFLTPQGLIYYDQLPLWLVPKKWGEMLILTVVSWVGYGLWWLNSGGGPFIGTMVVLAAPYVLIFFFLPALTIALFPIYRRYIRVLRAVILSAKHINSSQIDS